MSARIRSTALPWLALAALTLSACRPTTGPRATGRAALIIGPGDGTFTSVCVSFEGQAASGDAVLRASGLRLALDPTNPMGPMVCAIEGTGCDFPRADCLCACRGVGGCSYWAYLNWSPEAGWQYASLGAGQRQVEDGDLDAWLWLDRALPGDRVPTPPADLTFETICG